MLHEKDDRLFSNAKNSENIEIDYSSKKLNEPFVTKAFDIFKSIIETTSKSRANTSFLKEIDISNKNENDLIITKEEKTKKNNNLEKNDYFKHKEINSSASSSSSFASDAASWIIAIGVLSS